MTTRDKLVFRIDRLTETIAKINESLAVFPTREDRKDWIPCFTMYRDELLKELKSLQEDLVRLDNQDGQAVS